MMVDGKYVNDAQRIRLLVEMEDEEKYGPAPVQLELELTDDVRYQWKDQQHANEEPHRAMAGIIVAVCCSVPLLVLLVWLVAS